MKLPTLGGQRGMRVLLSLRDDRMRAYRAPVVEVVPMAKADWKPLAWPTEERTVKAAALKSWLSQIYPPGVMDRTNPKTKVVYAIKSTEGDLKLTPISAADGKRQAILRGVVRLTDEGPDDMSAHIRSILTQTDLTVPVGFKRLVLGTWQGVYLWEHRVGCNKRTVVLTVQS